MSTRLRRYTNLPIFKLLAGSNLIARVSSKSSEKKAIDNIALDAGGYLTYLAPTRVNLNLTEERYPEIRFLSTREH